MLSMGLTLTFEDFRRCLQNPWTVGVGFLAQYIIKPILGFFIAMTLKLSAPLATGLILVSCCPEGQASNVATYISKGQLVPVDAAVSICLGLALGTFQVVLVPTIIGVLANEFFPKFTSKIITITPLIGVILTTLLCASPAAEFPEPEIIHYNPKEFGFGKKKAFPFRNQVFVDDENWRWSFPCHQGT